MHGELSALNVAGEPERKLMAAWCALSKESTPIITICTSGGIVRTWGRAGSVIRGCSDGDPSRVPRAGVVGRLMGGGRAGGRWARIPRKVETGQNGPYHLGLFPHADSKFFSEMKTLLTGLAN